MAGGPLTLQIIVNDVLAGDSQTWVVMAPASSGSTPTPDPFGDDPRSLSSYTGRVGIGADGRSATISAGLAHGGGARRRGGAGRLDLLSGWCARRWATQHPVHLSQKTHVASIAPLLAEAILRIHRRESISVLFRD
jgi:hypothetical protein